MKKECKPIQDKLIDFLDNNLSKKETTQVKNHLHNCEICKKEAEQLKHIITTIYKEKEELPSTKLQDTFNSFLRQEIQQESTKIVSIKTQNNWKRALQVAASILLLISAFLLGKNQANFSNSMVLKDKKEEKVLAMFNNSSASKRILAVNNSKEFTKENTEIIQAIINKLLYDENANVRLAAVEALTKFSTLEMVKKALLKSLETEKDPIIQIELIHILAKIQEKRALTPMKRLLNKEETPNYVKHELANTITNLL